jgi:undecaprenyl diphosphate synthase
MSLFNNIFKKKAKGGVLFDKDKLPQHIAIIMDGNGRWAKKRGLPRIAGHKVGADSLREILKACAEFGVKNLTVYAFSTENWKRPKEEVSFLMSLLADTIDNEVDALIKNGVRLRFLGRLKDLPQQNQEKMKKAMEATALGTRINLNVMLSYGGRAEILDATNKLIAEAREGRLAGLVNEEKFSNQLYTAGIPDPDLLIRTASEYRVSNFLLWQISYAEFYITPVLWPDFRRDQLIEAIQEYGRRIRRYGAVK